MRTNHEHPKPVPSSWATIGTIDHPTAVAIWGHEWRAVAWMAACRRLTVALIHDDGVQNGMDVDAEALFCRYLSFEFDSIEEDERAVREMLGLWNEERDGLF